MLTKLACICSLVVISSMGLADNHSKKSKKILRYPVGCQPVGYHFDHYNLILRSTTKNHPQTVYFMRNISPRSVRLYQTRSGDEPYLMHANTEIRPKAWSVFATDAKQLKFICAVASRKSKHPHVIDCSKALDICEYPYARFGPNHHGNYWVAGNIGTHRSAKNRAKYHGILLVDQKQKAKDKNR